MCEPVLLPDTPCSPARSIRSLGLLTLSCIVGHSHLSVEPVQMRTPREVIAPMLLSERMLDVSRFHGRRSFARKSHMRHPH